MITFHLYLFVFSLMLFLLRHRINYSHRRWLIAGVILASVLVPLVKTSLPRNIGQISLVLPEVYASSQAKMNSLGAMNWLLVIWVAGSLISGLVLLSRWRKLNGVKRRALETTDESYLLHPKDEYLGAFCFGNRIFLPRNVDEHMRSHMRIHEQQHLRHFHSYERLFIELLKVVFWFNPAVYLLENAMKQLHERQADAQCTNEVDTAEYIDALLSSAMGMKGIHRFVQPFSTKKHIKTRIMMIHKKERGGFAIAMMGLCLIGMLAVQSCTKTAEAQTESTKITDKTVTSAAEYPGGMEAMFEYVGANLKYPKDEASKGTEGMVYVGFTIDANGEVKDVNIKKGLSKAFDDAAIELVESFPKWTPAMDGRTAVASELTLPIKFVLED